MEKRYHDLAIYRQKSSTIYSKSNPTPTVHKSSPFSSAQQVKEFIKLAEHLRASMLTISAQCILWNRDCPHFISRHTDSFALRPLRKPRITFWLK